MTTRAETRSRDRSSGSLAGDLVVLAAATVIAVALGTGLHLEAQIPLAVAVAGGLTAHVGLVAIHLLMSQLAGRTDAGAESSRRSARQRVRERAAEGRPEIRLEPRMPTPPPALPVAPTAAQAAAEAATARAAGVPSEHGSDAGFEPPASADEELITRSIEALRSASDTMRAPAASLPELEAPELEAGVPAPTIAAPAADADEAFAAELAAAPVAEAVVPPADALMAEIAEALESQRIRLALSPIVGLGLKRERHFEVVVRLDTRAGSLVVPADIAAATRGSGIGTLLEAFKVGRAARQGLIMRDAGEPGLVLCSVSLAALTQERVLSALFAHSASPAEPAERLVLSLARGDIEAMSATERSVLAELLALGFRFALHDVTSFDIDLVGLNSLGFAYLKVDAATYLGGAATAGAHIAPQGLNPYAEAHGFRLIVDRIDDQRDLARLVGLGAKLGQGALFPEHEMPLGSASAPSVAAA
jgi:EAL domain-containing protein (putative c-di-GMP-specific phosphodiesterase class I)